MNRAANATATARIRRRAALAAATETIDRLSAENDQLKATQLILEEGLGRCADRYDFAPIGLLTLDAAGIIREVNLKAASMLAIDARHAIGLTFASFVGDRRAFRRHLAECNSENLTIMTEMELVPRSGPVCNVDLVTRRANSGSEYRAVLVDVTERVRLAAAERLGWKCSAGPGRAATTFGGAATRSSSRICVTISMKPLRDAMASIARTP